MRLEKTIIDNKYSIGDFISGDPLGSLYYCTNMNTGLPGIIRILKYGWQNNYRLPAMLKRLTGTSHPNVAGIHDYGEYHGEYYIISENYTGRTLHALLKSGDRFPLRDVISFFTAAARAVNFFSENDAVHGELIPHNFVFDNTGGFGGGKFKLVNPGLSIIQDYENISDLEEPADIFGYLSPEHFRITGDLPDARSDLYSLGAVTYRLLTGVNPFCGENVTAILHKHTTGSLPPVGNLNSGVPEILGEIIKKLLNKDMESRYHPQGLCDDLERFSAGKTDFTPGFGSGVISGSAPGFYGRDAEVSGLKKKIDEASEEGTGFICLISGEPGIGKTRLAEEIRNHVNRNKGMFLSGKANAEERSVPYLPLSEVLGNYLSYFYLFPKEVKTAAMERIAGAVGDLGGIILGVNKSLEAVIGSRGQPPFPGIDSEREDLLHADILIRFLCSISAGRMQPVIFIDDMQWIDKASLRLLGEIAAEIERLPVILLGAYRTGEDEGADDILDFKSSLAKNKIHVHEIRLSGIEKKDMRALVSSVLKNDDSAVADFSEYLAVKSRGNPLFALEILSKMISEKAVYLKEGRWSIDNDKISGIDISDTQIDLIKSRIRKLSMEELRFLTAASVAGSVFDVGIVTAVIGREPENLSGVVNDVIRIQFIEKCNGTGNKYRFIHDRIREAFYSGIDPVERKKYHLATARILENMRADDDPVFEIAGHYIAAGEREKILEFAYKAGLSAKELRAVNEAIEYFRSVLEIIGDIDSVDRNNPQFAKWITCMESTGDMCLLSGMIEESLNIFTGLIPYYNDKPDISGLYKQISLAYYKLGDYAKCEQFVKTGLKLLGESLPLNTAPVVISILKNCLYALPLAIMRKFKIRKSKKNKDTGKFRTTTWYYYTLYWIYMHNDAAKAFRTILRMLNISAWRLDRSIELAVSLSYLGQALLSLGFRRAAFSIINEGYNINTGINHKWGTALSCQMFGLFYRWGGDYGRAINYYNMAVSGFASAGDVREEQISLSGLTNTYILAGDYPDALTYNEKFARISRRLNDNFGKGIAYFQKSYMRIEKGDFTAEDLEKDRSFFLDAGEHESFLNITFYYIAAFHYYEQNNFKESVRYSSIIIKNRKGLMRNFLAMSFSLFAEAAVEEYKLINDKEQHAKKLLKEIKKACDLNKRISGNQVNDYGIFLRVFAKYCFLIKRYEKAGRFYLKSIDTLNRTGRKTEAAKSMYYYALFLKETGNIRTSGENMAEAYMLFKELGMILYMERAGSHLNIRQPITHAMQKIILQERQKLLNLMIGKSAAGNLRDDFMHSVLAGMTEISLSSGGYVFLCDNDGESFHPAESVNADDYGFDANNVELIKEAMLGRKPVISGKPDATGAGNLPGSDCQKPVMMLPVCNYLRVMAVICLFRPGNGQPYTDEDIVLFAPVLKYLSAILENEEYRKRDVPGKTDRQSVTDETERRVKAAVKYIEKHAHDSRLTREKIAQFVLLHPDHLSRSFLAVTGEKIGDFISRVRINEAAVILESRPDVKIIDAAYDSGFDSLRTFNRTFRKIMGVSPKEYRESIMLQKKRYAS